MKTPVIDYAALRKKFPTKDPKKRKRAAAIRAIAREYEQKRAALGHGAPVFKKGIVFYAVVILGLAILGSLVLSATGKGGRAEISRAQLQARKSVDAVAIALGRYRYHVGKYPSTEEGLEALAAITPNKKGWNGPYVNHVVRDPWGHDYVYVNNGEGEYPTLYSAGLDGKPGTTDDVLPDRALYDEPFRDTSWTKGWMPYYLRGYVLAPDRRTKSAIEEEVKAVLAAEQGPSDGEFVLRDGWEFSRDRKEWKGVRVPHDWAVADGSARNGVGWYRRTVELPAGSAGKFVALRFGGAMAVCEVSVNGEAVSGRDCGNMSFEVDVSARLRFGEKNELLVKVDAAKGGPGLCRDVVMAVEDFEDRAIWGTVRITTPEISPERAKVRVSYKTPVSASEIVNEFEVEGPVLWDVYNPKLYETKVCGRTYRYAIRTVEFAAGEGVRLNGRRVQLRGAVLEPGLGPLGMAFDRGAMRRKLEILRDMGANALRIPRGAISEEVLALCDETGLIVLPEGCDVQCEFAEGFCDGCMMPKDRYWMYRAKWNELKETLRLLPHWSWDGRDGEKVSVSCCTSGDEAELFVNGESAGRRKRPADGGPVAWEVPYEPGEIKAIAFRNGHPIGEDFCKTAFKADSVKLSPEAAELADGELGFVKVEIVDEDGTALPHAADKVSFSLEGPGEIVSAGNGSPDGAGAGAASVQLYAGRALVIVRRAGGSGLPLRLTASAAGVRPESVVIPRK